MTTIEELEQRIKYLENLFPKCLNCGKIHREKTFYHYIETEGFLKRKKKMLMGENQFCSKKCLDEHLKNVEYI